jgi:hypothetical protein
MSRGLAGALAVTLLAGFAYAQPATPRRTSAAAIQSNPTVFHGKLVLVTGTVTHEGGKVVLSNGGTALRLVSRESIPTGDVEVRGVVLDLGRMKRDDPQLAPLQNVPPFDSVYRHTWPAPGEEIVVAVRSATSQSREVVGIAISPIPPLPLDVDFSAPVEGEADVRLDARIRLQFSRDVKPESLEDRIRISYSLTDSVERGEAQPPALAFSFDYDTGTRALELRPTQPLERFREVKVELLEGIAGIDGSVLRPWTLRFSTGGS